MIQLRTVILLLFLTALFSACGNKGGNSKSSQLDSISVPGTQIQESKLILQPLEEGEIRITETVFGATINLTGEPLYTKEIIKPIQLLVKDKYLITNNQRKDSIFMIFELPEMKCIAAFGVRGNGPDEFGYPGIVKTEEDSILFYIYDLTKEKVYKVAARNLKPQYYLTLPKQDRSFDDKQIIFIDSRSAYYSASTSKGKVIYYYNIDSLPQSKVIKDLAIQGKKGSWTSLIGDFGINLKYFRFAYAYKYFKRLKIIDIQSMKERNIVFEAEDLKKGLNEIATLEPTNITHYWGMSSNTDYFWMLYSGRTPVEVQTDNRNNKKYIYVEKYDWNGNPVKRYKLDDWGYFCVDEERNTLYLASTAGVHSLLKYNIDDSVRADK
jgi:hypothetical protein